MRVRDFFIFICHQLLGAWGIAFLAAFGLFSLFDMLPDAAGLKRSMHTLHWLLTENPFYPVQILTGLYFWMVSRTSFPTQVDALGLDSSTAGIAYSFLAGPVVISGDAESLRGRLGFYFGWGCQPRNRCIDQLLLTMPFYASAAYSFGALLARNMSAKTRGISGATEPSPLLRS